MSATTTAVPVRNLNLQRRLQVLIITLAMLGLIATALGVGYISLSFGGGHVTAPGLLLFGGWVAASGGMLAALGITAGVVVIRLGLAEPLPAMPSSRAAS